jgi:hypothetical protein
MFSMADEIITPAFLKEKYILEDKDYLLIMAIRDLTKQIKRLADK